LTTEIIMRRQLAFTLPPVALTGIALVAAGCGGTSQGAASGGAASAYGASAPAAKKAAAVTTRSTGLGKVLVDGQGRTLYLFEKDKGTTSSCGGACASVWPPLRTAGKGAVRGGPAAGKLGSTKRADGTTQLTYGGHPLYTYAGDGKPGDVNGQGLNQFGAKWYVLAPSGRKIDND
jgi:predicted lipoprotein with Yx(FWY)xxD motif